MDFGVLPPEINSARMYAGPGSGPMIAAAAAWDDLAAQLHSVAASYESVISALAIEWQGPSSAAMVTAAANVPAWMSATASLAEQTAQQATASTLAYETAFAATVPPPAVAANRVRLMALIATNLLGQNTPAIALTETEYAAMWAQDAVAMYGYAASSSGASHLTPFAPPRQVANSTGPASQAASTGQAGASGALQMASTMQQPLQGLVASGATNAADAPSATTAALNPSQLIVGPFNPLKLYEPFGGNYDFSFQNLLAELNRQNVQLAYDGAVSRNAAGLGPAVKYVEGQPVLASAAQSSSVGNLSVPPSWVSAAPAVRPVAFVVPNADPAAAAAAVTGGGEGTAWSNAALSSVAGRAVVGTDAAAARAVAGMGGNLPGEATTAMIIVIPEDD